MLCDLGFVQPMMYRSPGDVDITAGYTLRVSGLTPTVVCCEEGDKDRHICLGSLYNLLLLKITGD